MTKSCPLCGEPCEYIEAGPYKAYGCKCIDRNPLILPDGWVKEVCAEGRLAVGTEDIEREREHIRFRVLTEWIP